MYLIYFWDKVSFCSPGWPGIHYIDQVDLKFKRPACLCLLSDETEGECHHPDKPTVYPHGYYSEYTEIKE